MARQQSNQKKYWKWATDKHETPHSKKENNSSTPNKSNIDRENYSACHGVFTQENTSLKDPSTPSHSPNKEATVPNPSDITLVILIVLILIIIKY